MIIDTNVSLSRWPFRRLPCDEIDKLLEKLRAGGVGQAWAGSFDGAIHKDLCGVNARLFEACRPHPELVPFGSVNPKLPDWREDLRRCHEEFAMPGIRLHPNYHGYALDDPALAELLTLAEKRGLVVELVVRMEDPRTQHPRMPVPDVDAAPLPELVAARPKLRLVLLNALRFVRADLIARLIAAGDVSFDVATLEGVAGIANLLAGVPVERVIFGSHLPFFYLESALLKLRESELTQEQIDAITHGNAERLLGKA